MATKPKHIRVLQQLLDAEQDPQRKAQIATRLANAEEARGRERARQARANRNKAKAHPATPVFDGNEEFVFDDPPSATIAPSQPLRPDPLAELRTKAELEAKPDDDEGAPEEELQGPKSGDGYTRVLTTFEFLPPHEQFPQMRWQQGMLPFGYRDPMDWLGGECYEHDTHTLEGGWNNEREQREADAEAAYWDDYFSKIGR